MLFLKETKNWWIAPIIGVLVVVGTLLVISQGSALAPVIYAMF